ncbi:hypothetical protein KFL_008030020 [Klebsormidium nitens]|uniref:CCD97-like C-terminal domain-containing protein n=1 Tax=Klebsormidium nitens TaxID=105231 RepID=A0A1Y1IL12_KLENI|nr:hypothetical protein KFL_008030020 [Klebsormidium nitens]|eukprot:GAQ91540.1 hypothetical protein KFL_008030020 [Klebsormidium nitens]
MDAAAARTVCDRLSVAPDVEEKLPWKLRSGEEGATQDEKRAHLQGLLERDAALFLEKYGESLSGDELLQFEGLKGDYEVNWHLNRLNDSLSPSPQREKARAAQVKNRRLAYMQRLEDEGTYFSEDAMRERAPLLHEQFMGPQTDASETRSGRQPVVPRPGEGLSELIIRQAKEDHIAARLKQERQDFEKQAATLQQDLDDAAAASGLHNGNQAEREEEANVADSPGDKQVEPVAMPSLESPPSRGPSTGAKARGGVHQKTGQLRFGTISGASVAGAAVTVGPTDAQPAGSTLGVNEVGKGISLLTSDEPMRAAVESNEAIAGSSGEHDPSSSFAGGGGNRREPSNGASRVSGGPANANGHSVNGHSVNARSVNGRSVSGSGEAEEEVSHARFGEFTTPEPVSASRIASQVVRSVLESAGAGAGSRHPVTRYGEVRDGPFSGSADARTRAGASDRASRNVQQLGAGAVPSLEQRAQAAAELPPDAEERGGAAVGSSGGAGLRDGGRGIGDGGDEEMDTDEEELGSRTHTGMSELGGDTLDVDSGPKGQIDDFRRIMRERFLEGQDGEHVDYRAVDSDAKLDDDWLGQVDRDAQEKYFDED